MIKFGGVMVKKITTIILLSILLTFIASAFSISAAALQDPDLAEDREVRTPFKPNDGEGPDRILNNDYAAAVIGWWVINGFYYDYGKSVWCMIKLGDAEVTADGFKLYNGGNWGSEWNWTGAQGYNISGFQIYAAGNEGDALWDRIDNYYTDGDPQRNQDLDYINSNFALLYDTATDANIPGGRNISDYPVWPVPEGSNPNDYDDMSDKSMSGITYPNYERFPGGSVRAKYIVLAVTDWAWDVAIAAFEVFGAPDETIEVTGVEISETECVLGISETKRLTAAVIPANASNRAVTWSSDNTDIAAVDNYGNVKGVGIGTAKISATTNEGGYVAVCVVNVVDIPPSNVTIPQSEYKIILGAKLALWMVVEPEFARNKNLNWYSSDESVVKIDGSTGRLNAVGLGTSVITVKTSVGGLEASCMINVVENSVDKTNFFGISPTDSDVISGQEWDRYEEMGIKSLRIHLQHGNNWEDYKKVIEKANSLGIEIMMLVSYESYAGNPVSYNAGWGDILRYTREDTEKLIAVLEEAVPYFSDLGVKAWEIWNEQNGSWYMFPSDYANLITKIYEKFKYSGEASWDSEATIVFGGLDAVNGPWGVNGVNLGSQQYVVDFYNTAEYKTFKAKYGHSPFDAFGIHPYNTITVDENCDVNYNEFESAVRGVAISVMEDNGDGHIPVWITELGTQEANDNKQAAELRAYMESAYAMPEVARFHYFKYLYHGAGWSLVKSDGTPRKSLYEYSDVIAEMQSVPAIGKIEITGFKVKNSNIDIYFDIRSANGKGYEVYVSETGAEGSFVIANASFNSKGAIVKKLANGVTYYIYIVYEDSKVVEKSDVIKIEK